MLKMYLKCMCQNQTVCQRKGLRTVRLSVVERVEGYSYAHAQGRFELVGGRGPSPWWRDPGCSVWISSLRKFCARLRQKLTKLTKCENLRFLDESFQNQWFLHHFYLEAPTSGHWWGPPGSPPGTGSGYAMRAMVLWWVRT